MFNVRPFALALFLPALVACTSAAENPPQAVEPPSAPAVQPDVEAQAPTAPPPIAGRALEQVNLCDLVPNEEAAGLFGAEPTRGNLEGASGPSCIYQFTPDGGNTIQNVYVALVGTGLAEVSLGLARDEGAEPVAGLADKSLIRYVGDEEQLRLTGLLRDDFGFEIAAPGEQGAIRLAQLILDRLEP